DVRLLGKVGEDDLRLVVFEGEAFDRLIAAESGDGVLVATHRGDVLARLRQVRVEVLADTPEIDVARPRRRERPALCDLDEYIRLAGSRSSREEYLSGRTRHENKLLRKRYPGIGHSTYSGMGWNG